MEYTFEYTERNTKRASEFEAKALLYLIGLDKDRKKISLVFIDCFNDITGTNERYSELWDMQSKGVERMSPGLIGRSLATLFLNFSSGFSFRKFALFMPAPSQDYVVDKNLVEFGMKNFNDIQDKIEIGLHKELLKRLKIPRLDPAIRSKVKAFLGDVRFVIDSMHSSEYVKAITSFKDKDFKETTFYNSIFDEIKEQQSAKKLTSIHRKKITAIAEALQFNRHISSIEISQLLVNRLIGVDLFKKPHGIPFTFQQETTGMTPEETKELILDCKSNVCRAFFDKNKKTIFWDFLERVLRNLEETSGLSSREIYDKSCDCRGFESSHLSGISGIYFVSLIKDGLGI